MKLRILARNAVEVVRPICIQFTSDVIISLSVYFRKKPGGFVRKLIIDFENNTIAFNMLYERDPLKFKFSEVLEIYVTGYIIFIMDGQQFYMNETGSGEI